MIDRRRTVLVTDAGRGSAIAFLRSLGTKGWRVIAADSDARSAGFRSRHVHERLVYPDPARSPRAFAEHLLGYLGSHPVDLVIPITDECIHPIAHRRSEFERVTRVAIASDAALALVTDKERTISLASGLGMSVPETRVVCDVEQARAAAAELAFPIVVKPSVSRRYLPGEDRTLKGEVTFARDLAALEKCITALNGHRILLQEYRRGEGVGVECVAHEGEVRRAFQHRRLAEIPVTGGASAWRESMPLDPELFEHARALIRALNWTGLVMVEFKRGEKPWFLEVNGRVWGSLPLACLSGVDFPGELAELFFPGEGARGASLDGYRVGVRAYNLELMLSWIGQVLLGRTRHDYLPRPGRGRGLSGILGLLDPSQKSDLSGAGAAPRLAEASRIARKFARKLAGARKPDVALRLDVARELDLDRRKA